MGSFNESRYSNEERTICVVRPGVTLEMLLPYLQYGIVMVTRSEGKLIQTQYRQT